jgi:hypothetical protein
MDGAERHPSLPGWDGDESVWIGHAGESKL